MSSPDTDRNPPFELAKQQYSREFRRHFAGFELMQTALCQRAYTFFAMTGLCFLAGIGSRPFLWCALAFSAVMIFQYLRLKQLARGINVKRRVAKGRVAKGEKLEVSYRLENESSSSCPPVLINDQSPHLDFGSSPVAFTSVLEAGGKINLIASATCEAPAGVMTLGTYVLELQDEMGLFRLSLKLWDENKIHVHNADELQKLEPLRRTRVSPTMGDLESEKRGSGISLYGVREYAEGDPFASIHWKKSTFDDEFFVKEFEADISRRVAFVLDTRRERNLGYGASQTWETAKVFALKMIRSYLAAGSTVSLITDRVQLKDLSGAHNFKLFERAIEEVALADRPFYSNYSMHESDRTFHSADPFELCAFYLNPPAITYVVTSYFESEEETYFKSLALLRSKQMHPMICFTDIGSAAGMVKRRFGDFREFYGPSRTDQRAVSMKFSKRGYASAWIRAVNTSGQLEIHRHGA